MDADSDPLRKLKIAVFGQYAPLPRAYLHALSQFMPPLDEVDVTAARTHASDGEYTAYWLKGDSVGWLTYTTEQGERSSAIVGSLRKLSTVVSVELRGVIQPGNWNDDPEADRDITVNFADVSVDVSTSRATAESREQLNSFIDRLLTALAEG